MKGFLIIFAAGLIIYLIFFSFISAKQPIASIWKLPLNTIDRQNWATILLESDAHFKALRAPFGKVNLHYHTGVDLQIPGMNQAGEVVYAIAAGKVITIEDAPPQRRMVIEHVLPDGNKIWSVYIHIIEEQVRVNDMVTPETGIARTMNVAELNRYGWEYNHLHLELLKKLPPPVSEYWQRKTFTCYTKEDVDEYFYDPEVFLKNSFQLADD